MFKILFLILFVMSSIAHAQSNEKRVSIKFDEFGSATNGSVKRRMDAYENELSNDPSAQGYIINYGSGKEISKRERQIREAIVFRKFDASRIVIVNGGFRGEIKTAFWIVPAGAEPPAADSDSKKIDEFGYIAIDEIKARLDVFFAELRDNSDKKGYIVIAGPGKAVVRREKFIRNYLTVSGFDSSRIKFINDGFNDEIKNGLWIDL